MKPPSSDVSLAYLLILAFPELLPVFCVHSRPSLESSRYFPKELHDRCPQSPWKRPSQIKCNKWESFLGGQVQQGGNFGLGGRTDLQCSSANIQALASRMNSSPYPKWFPVQGKKTGRGERVKFVNQKWRSNSKSQISQVSTSNWRVLRYVQSSALAPINTESVLLQVSQQCTWCRHYPLISEPRVL